MRELIHNLYLAALNAAGTATSQSFVGNFMFQFHPEGMTALSLVSGKMVLEETEYSPVCLSVLEETPFTELSKRSDWLAVFQIMFRIEGDTYNSTDDPAYAVIAAVSATWKAYSVTSGSYKYAIKCREPKYLGFQTIGKSVFALFEVGMNITSGVSTLIHFGNAVSYTLNTVALDVVSFTKSFTRRFYTADVKANADPDYSKPTGSVWCGVLVFNYAGNSNQLAEVNGTSTLAKAWALVETTGSTTVTWNCCVETATETVMPGGVRQFTFTLRKA